MTVWGTDVLGESGSDIRSIIVSRVVVYFVGSKRKNMGDVVGHLPPPSFPRTIKGILLSLQSGIVVGLLSTPSFRQRVQQHFCMPLHLLLQLCLIVFHALGTTIVGYGNHGLGLNMVFVVFRHFSGRSRFIYLGAFWWGAQPQHIHGTRGPVRVD